MEQTASKEHLEELCKEDKACYIVLSCGTPDADGNMDVKMTYDGDPVLAAYLLQNACIRLEDQLESDPDVLEHLG